MSLISHFQQIRDYRTQPIYPLWVILVLVVMGTMSGCYGYRPLAAFVQRHQAVLLQHQDFVSLVSAFSVERGEVVAVSSLRNGHTSELRVVETLLTQLDLTDTCISLDALHTKKNSGHHRG
ncbi:MAG: transposase family protein [Cyanobacteria bacterium P01_B01_bin.77]